MKILFDHSAPDKLVKFLRSRHSITLSRTMGWKELENGDLLLAAEAEGFDLLLTSDKNLRYQQNLEGRRIALVVLGQGNWPLIKPYVAQVVAAVNAVTPGSFVEVDIPLPPKNS
jgi:predicted nuclease of predicted toxin-antitoxin system